MPMKRRETDPNEPKWISASRDGDKDAFRHLVETYQDRLYQMVLSMIRQPEAAEDLTQEIFVKAYFALPRFQGDSAFYTWLFRIGSNHCLDHLRRRNTSTVSLDATVGEEDELSLQNTLQAPSQEEPGETLKDRDEVSAVLSVLDPDQRLVLTLRELRGLSYEELADVMGCNINTIKSRLNRAREALKLAYDKKFGNKAAMNSVQGKGELL